MLHGDNGVIPFWPLGSSDYYSWTSLLSSGTIIDHGIPVKVVGLSWMDHQWGAFNLASGADWDWFSIQLANGRHSWTSPATGITYGSGWNLTVPGGSLTVTPDQTDQELDLLSTQGVAYWEGDVAVHGSIGGSPRDRRRIHRDQPASRALTRRAGTLPDAQ